jgi:penicillin-binding protein A
VNRQIRLLAVGLLVCYAALFVKLNILQVGQTKQLNADPRNDRAVIQTFNKPRGPIFSADGVLLASSTPTPDERFKFQRSYPTGELFANVTGYYSFTYGATQVEKLENAVLAGTTTTQQVGALGNIFNKDTNTTGSVTLTLRNDLQTAAKAALGDREGSAVVLDPRTGAILAMYSNPTFDPNLIASHDTVAAGNALALYNADTRKPLLANAYQERYMPGSTFKMLTVTAGLEAGTISTTTTFPVEKQFLPPQTTDPIQNYAGEICGGVLAVAFAKSCNTSFARVAVDLGPQAWVDGVSKFGVNNEAVPIDLPGAAKSTIGPPSFIADIAHNIPLVAIGGFGEGQDAITPLQMAMVGGTIANGGFEMKPYVVASTKDFDGNVISQTQPAVWKIPMSPATAVTVTQLMVGVVQNGTARGRLNLDGGVQAAAKTGTAQLNPIGQPARSHAWIVAFAPAEAPRFVVAVMLKGVNAEITAGTGGTLAGPIARQILNACLAIPQ